MVHTDCLSDGPQTELHLLENAVPLVVVGDAVVDTNVARDEVGVWERAGVEVDGPVNRHIAGDEDAEREDGGGRRGRSRVRGGRRGRRVGGGELHGMGEVVVGLRGVDEVVELDGGEGGAGEGDPGAAPPAGAGHRGRRLSTVWPRWTWTWAAGTPELPDMGQ